MLRLCLVLFSLLQAALLAQSPGTIFRREIDQVIAALCKIAPRTHSPSLGTDVVSTAQILTAMARCHRLYHATDGPVVRPSIEFLCSKQDADGAFGDAEATAWATAALASIDPVGRAAEVDRGRAALARVGEVRDPFEAFVRGVPNGGAAAAGATAQAVCREWLAAPAPARRSEVARALAQLVACQVATLPEPLPVAVPFTAAQQRGLDWLMTRQRGGVFAIEGQRSLPLTGFALMALQSKPEGQRIDAERAAIAAGLTWLLEQQNDDGTWGDSLQNYTTCVAVGALVRGAGQTAVPALAKARRALLAFQNAEAAGYVPADRDYGSIGYGGAQRGDLSNMQFALEALRNAGADDEQAFRRAVVFLQRTQNRAASNDFAAKIPDPDRRGMLDVTSGDDGGACYYPGNSSAGYDARPDGKVVARSYGSMTYALLKAYSLAGVPTDDPRLQAAVQWISTHWTLDENPGSAASLGEKARYQGLFYYYLLMAQALDQCGITTVTVGAGDHPEQLLWAPALRAHLESLQQGDGSWCNKLNSRWMEGDEMLCTCYALLALERCR